jgi:hypothetical protein
MHPSQRCVRASQPRPVSVSPCARDLPAAVSTDACALCQWHRILARQAQTGRPVNHINRSVAHIKWIMLCFAITWLGDRTVTGFAKLQESSGVHIRRAWFGDRSRHPVLHMDVRMPRAHGCAGAASREIRTSMCSKELRAGKALPPPGHRTPVCCAMTARRKAG